jgi:hypothetical protein
MNTTVAPLHADYVEIRIICPILCLSKVISSFPLVCVEEGGSYLNSGNVG